MSAATATTTATATTALPRVGFYEHDRGLHRGWYHRNYYGDRDVVIRRHTWD